MQSVFQNFTNLYSLSKTLRFELKPVGKTEKILEDTKVFKKDEIVQSNYELIKPFLAQVLFSLNKNKVGNNNEENK